MLCRIIIAKHALAPDTNNHIEYEPWARCGSCQRRHHKVCVLFHEDVTPKLVCKNCTGGKAVLTNSFTAQCIVCCPTVSS